MMEGKVAAHGTLDEVARFLGGTAPVPEHYREMHGVQLGHRVDRMSEQAPSPDRVEDLRHGRTHPGALTRGQHERGAGPRAVGHRT